ncbi:uncharacterized protein LOC131806708 [Musca domestica]|uniref:Uncharacterized protein LOC131806708 n=1 Tax=Musca domestica TaxID=7370 RepID=A0ABM3VND7_MUSDO|nr:uncharacterized protein LOC131806708 [Musca domestica]
MAPKITNANISSPSFSGKIKKPTSPRKQQSNLSYILYLHCEELRQRRMSMMRVSQTKLMLTHELITNTIQNIDKCSAEDLQSLSRETVFKNNLHRHIARQRHHQYLQMLRMRQKQNVTVAPSAISAQQKQQEPREEISSAPSSYQAEAMN